MMKQIVILSAFFFIFVKAQNLVEAAVIHEITRDLTSRVSGVWTISEVSLRETATLESQLRRVRFTATLALSESHYALESKTDEITWLWRIADSGEMRTVYGTADVVVSGETALSVVVDIENLEGLEVGKSREAFSANAVVRGEEETAYRQQKDAEGLEAHQKALKELVDTRIQQQAVREAQLAELEQLAVSPPALTLETQPPIETTNETAEATEVVTEEVASSGESPSSGEANEETTSTTLEANATLEPNEETAQPIGTFVFREYNLQQTLIGHSARVSYVSFHPDGRMLASASEDATIRLWDVTNGQSMGVLTGHQKWINGLALSPDGRLLASASDDKTVRVWDSSSGRELYSLLGHGDWVGSVSFSPDGRLLASGSGDKTVKLWDLESRLELRTLSGHNDYVRAAFSPDGQWLVTGSGDKTLKLWDVASGQTLTTMQGHSDGILLMAFSPSSESIASVSNDGTVKLWDTKTGRELWSQYAHDDKAIALTFHPKGEVLATGGGDNTIKLWDARNGELLQTLRSHDGRVLAVAFNSDGEILASGSFDQTIKLWKNSQ